MTRVRFLGALLAAFFLFSSSGTVQAQSRSDLLGALITGLTSRNSQRHAPYGYGQSYGYSNPYRSRRNPYAYNSYYGDEDHNYDPYTGQRLQRRNRSRDAILGILGNALLR